MEKNKEIFYRGALEEYEVLDKASPSYGNMQKALQKSVAEYVNKKPGQEVFNILEAGYGTLITTEHILAASPKISVIGFDESPDMFKLAIQKMFQWKEKNRGDVRAGAHTCDLRRLDNPNINPSKTHCAAYYTQEGFLRALILQLDFEDAMKNLYGMTSYFDGFASGFTLHNMTYTQREDSFRQLPRVIKPGGLFVSADKYAQDDEEEFQKNYNKQIELFGLFKQHGYPHLEKEWTEHYIQDDKIRFTENEQQILLRQNGFDKGKVIARELMDAVIVSHKVRV